MSMEEVLTARITADVSEAVNGFRQVDAETRRLQASIRSLAMGFTGVFTAGMTLYSAYERVQRVQTDVEATQEEVNKAYFQAALVSIPALISGAYNVMRLYTSLRTVLASATVAQWLYNKALAVTHALSGPAGWAILGIAAAVAAGTIAWMSMNRQQEVYNQTLSETTRKFRDLEGELDAVSPIERLQRQYQIVKEYYGYTVSVGNVNVSAVSLGSAFDRERASEELAKKIGHKVALKVITR